MTDSPPLNDPPQRLDELTAVLAQMGAVVLSAETIDTTIELVTTLAAETIPATTGAGVTLVDAHGKRSMAASDPLVERADALQYQFDSGPCLTAWRDQVTVRVDDTDGETRWPQWTAAVAELDLRAMLSVPLVTSGAAIGGNQGLLRPACCLRRPRRAPPRAVCAAGGDPAKQYPGPGRRPTAQRPTHRGAQ